MLGIVGYFTNSKRVVIGSLAAHGTKADEDFKELIPTAHYMLHKAINNGKITKPGTYKITMKDGKATNYRRIRI